jgi:hypothetical protein
MWVRVSLFGQTVIKSNQPAPEHRFDAHPLVCNRNPGLPSPTYSGMVPALFSQYKKIKRTSQAPNWKSPGEPHGALRQRVLRIPVPGIDCMCENSMSFQSKVHAASSVWYGIWLLQPAKFLIFLKHDE